MIDGNRVIALVPARGGSKSVPRKNLKALGGKPLIAWPIEVARETPEIDRVIVSTEDEEIADTARQLGAEVYDRSEELASDTAIITDVIRDLWPRLGAEGEAAEFLVLLEATSPFRTPEMIMGCLQRMVVEDLDSIATFHAADTGPEQAWRIEDGAPRPFIDGAVAWKPRQLRPPAYQLNGAVYAFRPDRLPSDSPSLLFGRSGAEIIDAESVIDIDTERDFLIANAILTA